MEYGPRSRTDLLRRTRAGYRGVGSMDHGVLIAIQRFPARQRAIEELAARDEDFRSLCADFAEAQAALRRWEEPSSAVRENARENLRSEYQTLVEELAG